MLICSSRKSNSPRSTAMPSKTRNTSPCRSSPRGSSSARIPVANHCDRRARKSCIDSIPKRANNNSRRRRIADTSATVRRTASRSPREATDPTCGTPVRPARLPPPKSRQ
ncbi:Uncharacterised protein [Mycobacteroides abscessus subsp. abscessus]|nr:Uncharacterised protein [Mycobacteroides abscessus subsp. abscessus]